MLNNTILEIQDAIPRMKEITFSEPVNWQINNGEHWAIIGANGSGKTILIDMITGRYALRQGKIVCKDKDGNNLRLSETVKSVAFKDIYSLADIQNSYYQQRWNTGDVYEVPLVKDLFGLVGDKEWLGYLIESFSIQDLLDKEINLLSSGELRKFLIVRSLLTRPKILILDNPYIGLDIKSRTVLNELFDELAKVEDLQIVLVLSNTKEIPDIITHLLPIKEMQIQPIVTRTEFQDNTEIERKLFENECQQQEIKLIEKYDNPSFANTLEFKNIHIQYGKRIILDKLDWIVKKGEKWALLGENGSGKSTLLSLVAADNPQAYANDITLFDRKRGTGESIWDIKKRIGYISPEMHLYYLKNVSCLDVVGSGFFDTIGLYRKCNELQANEALKWMEIFGVAHLKDRSFLTVSSGEQRLVLLARVFVKNPDLYILDEPLHGLDEINKKRVKEIIERYCSEEKTLIYVTHYEEEIPILITKRLILRKNNN